MKPPKRIELMKLFEIELRASYPEEHCHILKLVLEAESPNEDKRNDSDEVDNDVPDTENREKRELNSEDLEYSLRYGINVEHKYSLLKNNNLNNNDRLDSFCKFGKIRHVKFGGCRGIEWVEVNLII